MDMAKFIHAADLHLGRPFSGLKAVNAELSQLCREAGYEAWDRIVELACEHRVDFVTLGGDTFDGVYPTVRARVAFKRGIERLCDEGIPAFMVLGNHDPMKSFPENLHSLKGLHLFGVHTESCGISFLEVTDGAVIYGASFEKTEVRKNLVHTFRRDPGIGMAIGLLHANVNGLGGHKNYAPCTLDDLVATGMDAWCLGHIHAGTVLHEDPLVLYSGTSQGAHLAECGAKGCYLITLNSRGKNQHQFIPVAPVRWHVLDLDVTEVVDEENLLELAAKASHELSSPNDRTSAVVARINLRGSRARTLPNVEGTEVQELIAELLADLSPPIFLESIRDVRATGIDLSVLLQEDGFLGEFLRLCKSTVPPSSERDAMLDQMYGELVGRVSPRYITQQIDPRRFQDDSEAFANCLNEIAGQISNQFL
jgi:DNA repair exonuclease SbcCD nuclease subunit